MARYPHDPFTPKDPGDTPYKLQRAVKESGLSLQQICDRMKSDYGVELTPSAVSRSIIRGTLPRKQNYALSLVDCYRCLER
jgi:hypothetical protein